MKYYEMVFRIQLGEYLTAEDFQGCFMMVHGISQHLRSKKIQEDIIRYEQPKKNLVLGKKQNSDDIIIIPSDDDEEATEFRVDIQYLPQQLGKATFMQLDYATLKAKWFVTTQLSGCDMWVATRDGSEPYVIHINFSQGLAQGVTRAQIAEAKEEMANRVLDVINANTGGGFILVYRLIHIPEGAESDLRGYIDSFQENHPRIELSIYHENPTVFYAEHVKKPGAGVYGGWKFMYQSIVLKEELSEMSYTEL